MRLSAIYACAIEMQLSIVFLAMLVVIANGKPSRQARETSDRDTWSISRPRRDRDRGSSSNTKAVSVRGELFCGTVAATNVRVKLWAGETDLEPSHLLDNKRTDNRGHFTLEGDNENQPDLVLQQPVLTIYHNCDYDNTDKLRRVLIRVPSSYVGQRRFSNKFYDIDKLNLEMEYPKETHEKIDSVNRRLKKMFFF